jgi:hypothetical protein
MEWRFLRQVAVEVKGEIGREPGMGRVALTRGRRPVAPRVGASGSVCVSCDLGRERVCGRRAGVLLVFLMSVC